MELCFDNLKKSQNLLAFSAGADSTALFFLLLEKNIDFDIAIVDYNLRPQSKEEVAYAKELAKKYNKRCFIKEVQLPLKNFEAKARKVRYRFFEELIAKYGYQNLLTAHHLNDRLEWFLMQLSKGSGVVELVGMECYEKRESYTLVRPLLYMAKDEILSYLKKNNISYFIDKSNFDEKFLRNRFRAQWSNSLIKEFKAGIKRSFRYLEEDKKSLLKQLQFTACDELHIAKRPSFQAQTKRLLLLLFKKLGYLLSKEQQEEILMQKEGVIAGKIAFFCDEEIIAVAPFIKMKLSKTQKEDFRKAKVPPLLRGYFAAQGWSGMAWKNCIEKLQNQHRSNCHFF